MPTVTVTGGVKVRSEKKIGGNAKALGLSTNLESDVAIAAAVGLNVESITNSASIGAGSTVTGAGITVEAVTPDTKENPFGVCGLAGAGGKADPRVAASARIQVRPFHTTPSPLQRTVRGPARRLP